MTDVIGDMPLRIDELVGGSQVFSYALRDTGVDVMFDIPDQELVNRVVLGDMRFVAKVGRDGQITRLYFAPEFPNHDLGYLHKITTFYALPLIGAPFKPCELEVTDSRLRLVDWDEGLALARQVSAQDGALRSALDRIFQIEELVRRQRPNTSLDELRHLMGRATGARVLVSASLLGELAE